MKKIVSILLIFISITISAKEFDGYYITNEDDTIKCKVEIGVNLFREDLLKYSTVARRVKIFNDKGDKQKFKPNEIKGFCIHKTKTEDLHFKSITIDKSERFVLAHSIGKIQLYESATTHAYDGSEMNFLIIKFKDKNHYKTSGFSTKKLLEYLDNDEFFVKKLDGLGNSVWTAKWYTKLPEFVKEYNKIKESVK